MSIQVTIRQRRGTRSDPDWITLDGVCSDSTAYAVETAKQDQAAWLRTLAINANPPPHPRLPYHTRRGLKQALFRMQASGKDMVLTGILVAGRDWKVVDSGEAIILRLAHAEFDRIIYCDSKRLNEGGNIILGGTE